MVRYTVDDTDFPIVVFAAPPPGEIADLEKAAREYQEAVADLERLAWGYPADTNDDALELEVSAVRMFASNLWESTLNAVGKPLDGQEDLGRIFSTSHWEPLSNDEVYLSDDYCNNHYGWRSGRSTKEPD